MKQFNLFQILITIIAVVLTSVIIAYGWTAPTGGPPGNDVPPPINVGSIGQIKEGGLSVANTPTVSNVGFRVITGNLIIGSTTAAVSKGGIFDEFINAKDVWLRDANSGAGAWASSLSGGSVPGGLREGPPGCNNIITTKSTCNVLGCEQCGGRGCTSQYLTCGGSCGGGGAPGTGFTCPTFPLGTVICANPSNTNQLFTPSDPPISTNWSACAPPNACAPLSCIEWTYGLYSNTQTRTTYTCQTNGIASPTVETRSCTGGPTNYCASATRTVYDADAGRYITISNCYDSWGA